MHRSTKVKMMSSNYTPIDSQNVSGSVPAVTDSSGNVTVKFADSNSQTFPPGATKGKISGGSGTPRDADGSELYFSSSSLIHVLQVSWHRCSDTHVGILSSGTFNLSVSLRQQEQEYYLQPVDPDSSLRAASICHVDFSFVGNHLWDRFSVGLKGEALSFHSLSGSSSVEWVEGSFVAKRQPLTWYKTTFNAPSSNEHLALDTSTMIKGQVWINGQSIGRYYPAYKFILQYCIGQEASLVTVASELFGGDPCPRVMKKLSVEVICS